MRLFFGLTLPAPVRDATAAYARDARSAIPGRYADAANHHITLAFLGEVPPERLPEARAVLARVAAGFPAPRLTLDGPGYFGRAQNAIFILRVRSVPSLDPLHAALTDALLRAGLPADPGPFSPHITLARHAAMPACLPPPPGPLSFTAQAAHVFSSARNETGTLAYTPLSAVPFAKISPVSE
ncbi:MAG: RNA 2',3'-cyclic phosphodiesterase [Candidatus Ventricola sp.]